MPAPVKKLGKSTTTKSDLPEKLRPFYFHRLEFSTKSDTKNTIVSECPFCDKSDRMAIETSTGQFNCFSCKSGNIITFIRELWVMSFELTTAEDYHKLGELRQLNPEILKDWGFALSATSNEWIIPGFDKPGGKMVQLYVYRKPHSDNGKVVKPILLATPTLSHGWFCSQNIQGKDNYNSKKAVNYIQEGPWDGVRLQEVMSQCKETEEGGGLVLQQTSNPKYSMLAEANVLATPGCSTFKDSWTTLFKDKSVIFMYDNDHPKENKNGQIVPPAGTTGVERAVQKLLNSPSTAPSEAFYLQWGKDGYDPDLPSGTDTRDFLSSKSIKGAIKKLDQLLDKVVGIPDEWIEKAIKAKTTDNKLSTVECVKYKDLITQWRKALRWTDGLDASLSVMLSSIISTTSVGDQLWVKIIGPASCLDGDTPIYDPINKTALTVRQRQENGTKFFVRTKYEDGSVGIAAALPPQKSENKAMFYDVKLKSGKVLRVTGGRQIWNGDTYVSVFAICEHLQATKQSASYPLLTSSESDLLAREQDVLHLMQTVGDSQSNCDDEQVLASVISFRNVRRLLNQLTLTDAVVSVNPAGYGYYYDFSVPETQNYYAKGLFHHNCGKSTLCEAISVADKYVYAKSTIRGFLSGTVDETGEDYSLVTKLKNKTFVTKDGDTLLQSPNLNQILSEARDLYDTVTRSSYRNKASRDYQGIRMTWILCGTSSLRSIDSSELGERFLDCVMMDGIDEELENDILRRVAYRSVQNLDVEATADADTQQDPNMTLAMQKTGGYVNYLRENAQLLLSQVVISDEDIITCTRLGKFVAYMRARPSKYQTETAEREFAARLVSQHVRLMKCMAAVLNSKKIDTEVMRRTFKVSLDTARGIVLNLVEVIRDEHDRDGEGVDVKQLSYLSSNPVHEVSKLVQFMRKLGIIEFFSTRNPNRKPTKKIRLTEMMENLCVDVLDRYDTDLHKEEQ